jgi:Ca2+-binding RTX toxin-like protein
MNNRSPIQHLEPRRLFANFATLNAGTLTLTGTSYNDSFILLERSGKLRVIRDGAEVRFAASAVAKVIATLDAGNDSFVMNSALMLPATVFGGDGDDTIATSAGADRIEGGNGEDWIYCGYGNDRVYGGKEYDTLSYQGDRVGISVTNTVKTEEVDPLPTISFDEFLSGNVIRVDERDRHGEIERIEGTDVPDSMKLSVFFHFYYWETERRRFELDGGDGDDSIAYKSPDPVAAAKLIGGEGNDLFASDTFDSTPLLDAGRGTDTYRRNSNHPTLAFTMPSHLENLVIPNGFDGEVTGNDLANDIRIQATSEPLRAKIDARDGDDRLFVQSPSSSRVENNTILGGDGDDRIEYYSFAYPTIPSFSLGAPAQPALIRGGAGNDTIVGTDSNETLYGDAGDDLIYGGGGADRFYGGDGNDTLDGQGGRDFIYGGSGTDRGRKQSSDRAFDSIELLL